MIAKNRPSPCPSPAGGIAARNGFALPGAIFALVVVAVLVTAGFYISGQERTIGQSTVFASQAEVLAETGLNEMMATWSPSDGPLALGQTSSVEVRNMPALGGEWQAQVTRVGDRLYLVESTGVVNQVGRLSGARRTFGMLARLLSMDITADAALVTRGDVRTVGGSVISGFDQNPPGRVCPPPGEDKPGVITDHGSQLDERGNSAVEGNPPLDHHGKSAEELLRFGDLTFDDLAAIADTVPVTGAINNTGPQFNDDGSCDESVWRNWGDPGGVHANPACRNYFPIKFINGDANIQSNGRGQGILLVNGDLRLQGGFYFEGIIMVRGKVEIFGSGHRVFGSLVAAREFELDPNHAQFGGGAVVQYSSCAVATARDNIPGISSLARVGNRGFVNLTASGS